MRETAIAVLARFRVPELGARARTAAGELAALERELAAVEHRTPWWERAVFARSHDARRAAELSERIAAARAERDAAASEAERALAAASSDLPPIEIAIEAEQLIARVLSDPGIGRFRSQGELDLARRLETLADRVANVWVFDFDPERAAAAVAAHAANAKTPDLAEPRLDERLGWAPIDESELVERAAAGLGDAYRDAQARLQREASEHATAAEALARARAKSGIGDWLSFTVTEQEHAVNALSQTVAREHAELFAASETVFELVERAIAAFPPMAIYAAASAAAGVLRAELHAEEPTLTDSGPRPQASAGPRAVLLAALIELRHSVERAFPGLPDLVSGRGGARDAAALARAARGVATSPYRERASDVDEHGEPLHAHDAHKELALAIDRSAIRPTVGRILAHAAMLGGIERALGRASGRMDWADRLMFWSDSPVQRTVAALRERRDWHRRVALALMSELALVVDRAAQSQPLYRLRNVLHLCHHAIASIATNPGNVRRNTVCGVFGRDAALAATSSLANELGRTWRLGGDRSALAHDVSRLAAELPSGPPPVVPGSPLRLLDYTELVQVLAHALAGSAFVGIEERLRQATLEHQLALGASDTAARQVTLWDRINIFTDSPAEEQRDRWSARAHELLGSMSEDFRRADALLEQALAIHPPAALYYRIGQIAAAVQQIHAALRRHTRTSRVGNTTTSHTTYTCQLVGREAASATLAAWTAEAFQVFGRPASNGELLEWFIGRELDEGGNGLPIAAPL